MSELWMQKRRQKGQAPQPSPNIANFSMRGKDILKPVTKPSPFLAKGLFRPSFHRQSSSGGCLTRLIQCKRAAIAFAKRTNGQAKFPSHCASGTSVQYRKALKLSLSVLAIALSLDSFCKRDLQRMRIRTDFLLVPVLANELARA